MDLLEAVLWLALNIYHEARSEDFIGKKAVAHVTMNRSHNRDLSIKETVEQPKQFSWVHLREKHMPDDWEAYLDCLKVAYAAANEEDFTQGATHYHLETVYPSWRMDPRMKYIGKYGHHLFYRYEKIKRIKATKLKRKPTKGEKYVENQTLFR